MTRRPFPVKLSIALVVLATAATTLVGGAQAATFPNAAAITINDGTAANPAAATPYPSVIGPVAGLTGNLSDVNVTITGFSHCGPCPNAGGSEDDVDILLATPNGTTVVLLSDAGGFNRATNLNITFDQDAATFAPDSTGLSSTSYKPSNYGPVCGETEPDVYPAGAPSGPYGSSLSDPALLAQTGNGNWSLYVDDDCGGDSGSISGGWSITVLSSTTAVLLRSFAAYAYGHSVSLRWRTASEAGVLGFNLVRFEGDRAIRVNNALIRAKAAGSIADAAYRLVDRSVRPGSSYTYRLQEVRLDGSRVWLGTAGVRTAT